MILIQHQLPGFLETQLLLVLIAVALMVRFYALAVGAAGALLWVPYAQYVYFHTVSVQLGLGCIGSAFVILYAVRPRRARFAPPGRRLGPAEHPGLFGLIHEVAAAARQDNPHEVYLGGDVNACIGHRGGTTGIGGQQTMAIGLPLLLSLTTRELRAVIAHEFGHYVAGDVRLGPWIYQTRAGLGGAVEDLQSSAV